LERAARAGKIALTVGIEVVVLLEAGALGVVERVYTNSEGEGCCHKGEEGGDVHGCGFGGSGSDGMRRP